ncbi:calponin homology domain-containing protein DDB_G0272472-like [Actinia tenebrosa]|uniref:Calponin homology domain-containing protein DDB_G0272472-like n=1 Tax=Actinia tenebrosa TaxID=6105 RepID=A0A6P8H6K5_ACTTE|nr:calponin homology domain-containing protein DDB_G0272472-like [Actinia tenebrosa]
MDGELEQMSDEGMVGMLHNSPEIKTLKDVRRYDKKTLVCPGGCEAQLLLSEIAGHECVEYLKNELKRMDENFNELESRVAEMVAMEAYYKEKLSSLENKIEEMTEEMKVLLLERTRRDEIFSSKETFYKEQTAALKEQVAKLEKRRQEGRSQSLKRPSGDDQDEAEYDIQRVEREWALRYDKLLAEKITMETLYQRKDREYRQEMSAMKQEVYALRDSLRLEREVMALEYDQANFEKLQSLIDQLEELVRQKRIDTQKFDNAEVGEKDRLYPNHSEEEYVNERDDELGEIRDINANHAKKRPPDSVGSLESEEELIIESN